jgi:hypothetical protein
MKNNLTAVREKLAHKCLFTERETRLYLGLSKRQFAHLVKNDPFFPKPKAGKLYSRFRIDDWLRLNNTDIRIDIDTIRFSPHNIKIPISMSQLN